MPDYIRLAVRVSLLSTLVCTTTAEAVAQDEIYTFVEGLVRSREFGYSVAAAGDLNQDGYEDVLIGAPGMYFGGRANVGRAWAKSGRDGRTLYYLGGDKIADRFGHSVAGVGDIDKDSFPDFIVGAPGGKYARVFSGVDGSLIRELTSPPVPNQFYGTNDFGVSVAGAGDVNADGVPDVIVGESRLSRSYAGRITETGGAFVISGDDGSLIYPFHGGEPNALFGFSVAGAGDVNGDGYDDVLVGVPARGCNAGLSDCGRVWVFSGFDGVHLNVIYGLNAGGQVGWSVAAVGDVDRDGHSDFMVGAPSAIGGVSKALVYSGRTSRIIHQFEGALGSTLTGFSVGPAGDINNDGYADVFVGSPGEQIWSGTVGAVRIRSGKDGSILSSMVGNVVNGRLGWSVAGNIDINRDGTPDYIVGGERTNSVKVLSGKDLNMWSDVHELRSHLPGTQTLTIDAGQRHAGRSYFMLGSVTGTVPGTLFGGVHIPLNIDTWTLAELNFVNSPVLTNFAGNLDASGRATATINVPPGLPSGLGFSVHHAYLVYGRTNVPHMASNAVPLFIR